MSYRIVQNLRSWETHALPIRAVVGPAELTSDTTLCGVSPFDRPHWSARWVLRGVVTLGYAKSGIGCPACQAAASKALDRESRECGAVTA